MRGFNEYRHLISLFQQNLLRSSFLFDERPSNYEPQAFFQLTQGNGCTKSRHSVNEHDSTRPSCNIFLSTLVSPALYQIERLSAKTAPYIVTHFSMRLYRTSSSRLFVCTFNCLLYMITGAFRSLFVLMTEHTAQCTCSKITQHFLLQSNFSRAKIRMANLDQRQMKRNRKKNQSGKIILKQTEASERRISANPTALSALFILLSIVSCVLWTVNQNSKQSKCYPQYQITQPKRDVAGGRKREFVLYVRCIPFSHHSYLLCTFVKNRCRWNNFAGKSVKRITWSAAEQTNEIFHFNQNCDQFSMTHFAAMWVNVCITQLRKNTKAFSLLSNTIVSNWKRRLYLL